MEMTKTPTVMWNKYGIDQVYCHCGRRAFMKQRALTGGAVYECPMKHKFKEDEVKRVKTKFDPV